MDLLMNGLLTAATLFAGGYCWVLARRVRDLKSLNSGLGGAIVTLTRQVELARTTLDEARAASRDTRQDLAQLVAKADGAAGQLRMLIAAAPVPAPVPPPAAVVPAPAPEPKAEAAPQPADPPAPEPAPVVAIRPAAAARACDAGRAPGGASDRGAEAAGAGADREPASPQGGRAGAGAQRGRHSRGAERACGRPLKPWRRPAGRC